MRYILLCLIVTSTLFATYYDSDIDGVEDKFDLCPNTSFDVLVDESGCGKGMYQGSYTIKVGTDFSFDTSDTPITTYNFLLQYAYKDWIFSLSNSNYIGYDENNKSTNEIGDIYFNVGYMLQHENFSSLWGLGMKIATADASVGTGENDYYVSTHIETNPFDLEYKVFTSLVYTFTGNNTIQYEDIFSYSFGIKYSINEAYTTVLYYENSQSIYTDTENYEAWVWSNHYSYNEKYFFEFDYTHGLDSLAYAHIVSFRLGSTF